MIDKESRPERNVYSYTRALNNFRDNMKAKRLKKGLSQKKLAQIVGTSLSTIKNYENGTTIPTGDAMVVIAMTLDMTLDEMIENDEKNQELLMAGEIFDRADRNPIYDTIIDDIRLMSLIYKKVRFELEAEDISEDDLNLILGGDMMVSKSDKIELIKLKNEKTLYQRIEEVENKIKSNLDKYDEAFGYIYKGEVKRRTLVELFTNKLL